MNVITIVGEHAQNTNYPVLNKNEVLVQKASQYLQANLNQQFVLNDVAKAIGSSRSKLAEAFKLTLGLGVFQWLREQRMLKAKSLLIETYMPIQEVGFEVGYENSCNFSTAYKKRFKISPRQQRQLKIFVEYET